jgi:t-SNARE complex subunit (syntaxin)
MFRVSYKFRFKGSKIVNRFLLSLSKASKSVIIIIIIIIIIIVVVVVVVVLLT